MNNASDVYLFPASFGQEQLWSLAQLAPNSTAYNIAFSFDLRGRLDRAALTHALEALVRRHDALRTGVALLGDGLKQVVHATVGFRLGFEALDELSPVERESRLAESKRGFARMQFDLESESLLAARLMRLQPDWHVLLLCVHHIVVDHLSVLQLGRELGELYGACRDGNAPPDVERLQFGDYAVWQREQLTEDAINERLAYWIGALAGRRHSLDLPTDRPRPAGQTFVGEEVEVGFDPELSLALRQYAQRRRQSLFMVVLAGLAIVLQRYTGERDVTIGSPFANRPADEVAEVVGLFMNVLPIPLDVDPGSSFESLLSQVRRQMTKAQALQDTPFERIVTAVRSGADASANPLVQVFYTFQDAPLELHLPDLEVRSEPLHNGGAKLDLSLWFWDDGDCIRGRVEYNVDLYEEGTARRIVEQLGAVLARAIVDDAAPVASLALTTASDLAQLAAWNATACDVPRDRRIESLVADRVAAQPAASAVRAVDGTLDYATLWARAGRVAAALAAAGVRAGDRVGLLLERDAAMLPAVLGVLRAGACYVPLDPAFPADRIAYMAGDAGLRLVLGHAGPVDRHRAALGDRPVLDVGIALAADGEAPSPSTDASADAYVIYTSGSTGRPKGVRVPHEAVANFFTAIRSGPGLEPSARFAAVTTLSFDIAVMELLLPLATGASVVLVPREVSGDGSALAQWLLREQVDALQATPATWRLLLAADWGGDGRMVAYCGGEPMPNEVAAALLPRVARLWNLYGPTETTVWSTFHPVAEADLGRPIPIGRPLANTRVHVLGPAGAEQPIGVVGELVIAGAGVARGYLDRPELTAERFITLPDGRRAYRTGDLGRWRADGVLECLGRTDFQVKLRGYRIELGEIEAVLATHAGIAQAACATREIAPGDVRLVAWFVPAPGSTPDPAALRAHLADSLPDYMLPQQFVPIDVLPLTGSGKVDRRALPLPAQAPPSAAVVWSAPRDPLEALVARLYAEVLAVPAVGTDQDFFALGGHSLLAAQLVARLGKEAGVALPMRAIFEAPSVASLARAVAAARGAAAPRRQPILHDARRREAPLTVMQERIRFMEDMHPGRVVYNTPSAHRLTGPLQRAAFEQALQRLVRRQPALRCLIAASAAGPVQRVLDELAFELPFEDLSELGEPAREQELMRRMQAVIDQPIDLGRAPLFRAVLYRMAPEQHVFLFMPHHIVWDGWSFDLLYQEMAALYPAALEQRPERLPQPPVTYLDYAHWHAQWMASDECAAQVRYWKERYARAQVPNALPTDRPRRGGMSGTGAVEWVHVDKALTERLREVARGFGATLNMLVMAVYAALLSEAVDGRAVVLGIPVRGRLISEVESVMGFFNNLLPTPLHVEPEATLAAWTDTVKREMLDSFANQDVPFERLAGEPEIAAHASQSGLYQSLYSFQDARERPRNWGPLSHQSVLVMQKGATEDFGLWLMEVPGGLEGGVNYNVDLFEPASARIFRERLLALLRRAADAPGLTVAGLLAQVGDDTTRFADWIAAHRARSPRAAAPAAAPAAPDRAPAEQGLAEIWARLLGIDAANIAAGDNFFDLGGNSLLAMQAVAAAQAELGLAVEPRRYLHESLAQLAGTAGGGAAAAADLQGALARLWGELLGIDGERILASDNFFDLGGNSLLAMRAVAEGAQRLGLVVEPRRYVHETLGQLAATQPSPAPADAARRSALAGAAGNGGLLARVVARLLGRA